MLALADEDALLELEHPRVFLQLVLPVGDAVDEEGQQCRCLNEDVLGGCGHSAAFGRLKSLNSVGAPLFEGSLEAPLGHFEVDDVEGGRLRGLSLLEVDSGGHFAEQQLADEPRLFGGGLPVPLAQPIDQQSENLVEIVLDTRHENVGICSLEVLEEIGGVCEGQPADRHLAEQRPDQFDQAE